MTPKIDPRRAADRIVPAAVFAGTFAAFLPVLGNGFVNWDDAAYLLHNPHFRGLDWERLKWMFTTLQGGLYQPLSWLTYGVDYVVWGMDPFGYHLTSLILHSLGAALFYFLCRRLIRLGMPRAGDGAWLVLSAGLGALLWAVHPLRVESVAWATERRDVLSGALYVLTLLLYLEARAPGRGAAAARIGGWSYFACLVVFALSLLAKGIGITLPLVLVLLDVYPLRRLPGRLSDWLSPKLSPVWIEKIPFFLLAGAAAVVGVSAQLGGGNVLGVPAGSASARMLFGLSFYLEKTLAPWNLLPLYEAPAGFGLTWPVVIRGLAVACLAGVLIASRKKWPAAAAAGAFYLIALLPVIGAVQYGPQLVADRYAYLPSLGWSVLGAAGLAASWKGLGRSSTRYAPLGLAGAVVLILGFLTWSQAGVWRDSETLWRRVLAGNPRSATAHNNLGAILHEMGKTDKAVRHFREALRTSPSHANALRNLAVALWHEGDRDEAARLFAAASATRARSGEAERAFADLLGRSGDWHGAFVQYEKAVAKEPDNPVIRLDYGAALASRGRLEAAIEQYRAALRSDPGYAPARFNLGNAFYRLKRFDDAARSYAEVLRLDPSHGPARDNLARTFAEKSKAGR